MKLLNAKSAAIAIAAPLLAFSAPTLALDVPAVGGAQYAGSHASMQSEANVEHRRKRNHSHRNDRYDRYDDDDDDYRRYRNGRNYDERVSRNTQVWRGRDGQYYCKKENGTTGLLIGAAVGGLAGNELAGRGDRTLGAILGAAGGAILGRTIDRSNSRCR